MGDECGGWPYARLARFGPFFVLDWLTEQHDRWRPVGALAQPDVLCRRTSTVSDALRTTAPDDRPVPLRVAASVTQLGLCARLSAVALGSAVDGLPVPTPERLCYRDELGGPYPLALLPAGPGSGPDWPLGLLDLVRPVAQACVSAFPLSAQVIWGNVASGLNGAAQMIATAQPDASDRAAGLLDAALDSDELRDTLTTELSGVRRRRSCCLIYQLADSTAAVCGDCILAGPSTGPGRRR